MSKTIDASLSERPIRVMRIIARLNIGGPSIHVSLLTKGLHDEQFESMLVTGMIGEEEGDMAYLTRELGVEPVFVPSMQREISPLADLHTLRDLIRLMRDYRPHIVHTHTAKAGFVGRLAAFLAGVPVIVHTFHGHVFRGYFGRAKTALFIMLERLAARISSTVLTISDRLRDDLLEFKIAPPEKIQVIPLGLDLTPLAESGRLRGQFRKEWGYSTDAPLIGIIGRLVPIKNHALFLEAARCLQAEMPAARFIIVGDGERREELEALVTNLGLTDCVTFTGWRRDLARIYADLDVVIITSHNEGTPVSLIEAMSAGVPVISTAVGGVPDLLKQGELGMLVAPGEVDQLVEALLDCLHHPDPERVKLAQESILKQYHADRLINDLRNLYRELLKM